MRGYRVFDVIENRYSDKDFFIDKDGKLYVRAMYFNHEPATRATVTTEEVDPSRYIVEESTGLKDKNDKMIFEGDVVSFWPTLEHERGKIKCEITYSMHGFWAKEIDIEYDRKWIMYGDVEIIGNVHNNPELLEVTE